MANDTGIPHPVKTGLHFASELVIPGGSNLLKGDYKEAGIHAVLGLVAKAMFGLPGLIVVSANSFTKATTGRGLLEHLDLVDRTPAPPKPAPPPPVTITPED
jgi:hypothetical protein